MSPSLRDLRAVVESLSPFAHVFRARSGAYMVEISSWRRPVEDIREALPAAEVRLRQERRNAHGSTTYLIEITPAQSGPDLDGGPLVLGHGAA